MSKKNLTKEKRPYRARPLKDYKLRGNKNSKKRASSKKKRKLGIFLLILTIVLIIILGALLIELEIVKNPIKNPFAEPELFIIKDRCSLIVGQLMHTINNEDSCKIRCDTECEVREMEFDNFEFLKKENDCNECKCYCK